MEQQQPIEVIEHIYDFLLNCKNKVVVLYGGSGAGKSYTIAQYLLIEKLYKTPARVLVTRKVNPSIRLSVYKLFLELLEKYKIPYEEARSIQTIYFPLSGAELIFRGMDDPEKIKSAEFNYIWMEEANEFDFDDYQQLKLRLRRPSKDINQLFLSFNPVMSWIKDFLFDQQAEKDIGILNLTYKDNPFLPSEYIELLKTLETQDDAYYTVYVLGQFAEIGEAIYTKWEMLNEMPTRFDDIVYGVDFGFNFPSVILEVGLQDNNIYVLREFYETRLTNADLIQVMKKFITNKKRTIYCDPSEPDRIEEMRREGFFATKGDNDVLAGIDFLKSRRIYINPECVHTLKEIRNYSWQKAGTIILDKPVKINDHTMDALRYATTGWRRLGSVTKSIATIKRVSIADNF